MVGILEIIEDIVKVSFSFNPFENKLKRKEIGVNISANYNNLFISKQDWFLKELFDENSKFYKIFNIFADYSEESKLSFLEELIRAKENKKTKLEFDKIETKNEIAKFMSFNNLWKKEMQNKISFTNQNVLFKENEIDYFLSEIEWILYLQYNLSKVIEGNPPSKKQEEIKSLKLIELNSTIDYIIDWLAKSSSIQYYLLWLLDDVSEKNSRDKENSKDENEEKYISYPFRYLLTEILTRRLNFFNQDGKLNPKFAKITEKDINLKFINEFLFS